MIFEIFPQKNTSKLFHKKIFSDKKIKFDVNTESLEVQDDDGKKKKRRKKKDKNDDKLR